MTLPAGTHVLHDQLRRMRSMLYAYSDLFFRRIRDWSVVAIALLVLGTSGLLPTAVLLVPFVVPFAFLETGYLYWYTIFARRHAGRLEQAINDAAGLELLAAHRLEEAFFTPAEAPKLAAFSFARPLGYPSLMTLGYASGAALLWGAGMIGSMGTGATAVPLLAIAWTVLIITALCWLFLGRHDEDRLAAALASAYLQVTISADVARPGSRSNGGTS